LTTDYAHATYENIFYMIKEFNWSFTELYILPIALRNWYIELAAQSIKKLKEASN